MVALAKEMRFDLPTVRDIGLAGLLHDIGKAGIAPELLDKTTALTTSETAILRDHPAAGYEILKDVAGLPPIVLDVCAHHHERPDGLGYPIGIAGEALSVHARMAAICDFYDKMTCPPAGAVKWSPGEAIEHLRSSPGAFDPQIVTTFVRTIGTFLPGVLVRLNSNRLGVVLDERRRARCTRPSRCFSIPNGGRSRGSACRPRPIRSSASSDPSSGSSRLGCAARATARSIALKAIG